MADPRTVAAEQRRNQTEMKRLADLAAATTDPADRHRHLLALVEQAALAAPANQICRYRHTGCSRRATRAVFDGRSTTGRAYDRRSGRGACASCHAREQARRSLERRRAAAAPTPVPRARSVAGLMRSYGLR